MTVAASVAAAAAASVATNVAARSSLPVRTYGDGNYSGVDSDFAPKIEPDRVKEIVFKGGVNTPDEILLAQVAENIRRGLPQAQPYQPNGKTALIVCGGPSLKTTEKDLVKAHWAGGKVVAINGSYNWCIERNIRPSVFVMLDAREFNSRFVEQPVDGCKYFLAAQCHPKAFEFCRGRDTTIWHGMSAGEAEQAMLDEYYFGRYNPVTLGTTVAMRAISLMRMIGFTHMEIFGLDSCWFGDEHHAYDQSENNGERRMSIWLRPEGRDDKAQRFVCSPWMAKQAEDFMQLIKERSDLFQLNVHGPGLIATILRTGAELATEGD